MEEKDNRSKRQQRRYDNIPEKVNDSTLQVRIIGRNGLWELNISISLIPYQELVEKLVDENDAEQRKEYASFIISTINKIFTSPTDEIFKDKKSNKGMVDERAIKMISQIGDTLSKFKSPNL